VRFVKFLFFVSFLFIISCSFSKEGKYRDLLKDYKEGKISDVSEISKFIINNFALLSFENRGYFFNKSVVLKSGSRISFLFPKNTTLKGSGFSLENVSFADINAERALIGNDGSFGVFDLDGNLRFFYNTEKNYSIDGLSLRGNEALLFEGNRLKIFNPEDKSFKNFTNGVYSPPYNKFYKSMILSSDKYISLITGIAGAYYINVFDSKTGNPLVNNMSASSFEFNQSGDYIIYVRGTTGNWAVVKFDIVEKTRSEILSLSKLSDLFIGQSGFIYISDNRLYIVNLKGEKYDIPMDINVKGICRNTVLVEYDSKIYLIDFDVLMERIREFHSME